MASAGYGVTALLRNDGLVSVIAKDLHCKVPDPPEGVWYTQVSAGCNVACLRSDGQVVLAGEDHCPSCVGPESYHKRSISIPDLPPGLVYKQVSTGLHHTLLLRSDGQVFAIGCNCSGQCEIPDAPSGITYTQVSAGELHSCLLRSDGRAVGFGLNDCEQSNIPEPPLETRYIQVSAGDLHTVLLRSDGGVTVAGNEVKEYPGYAGIPPLPDGIVYTQVSAGLFNDTALLRSDGSALIVSGEHPNVQIPSPPADVFYESISTNVGVVVALRSDGVVTAIGCPYKEEDRKAHIRTMCKIPTLPAGVHYSAKPHTKVVQIRGVDVIDYRVKVDCFNLAGDVIAHVSRAVGAVSIRELRAQLGASLCFPARMLCVVFPNDDCLPIDSPTNVVVKNLGLSAKHEEALAGLERRRQERIMKKGQRCHKRT